VIAVTEGRGVPSRLPISAGLLAAAWSPKATPIHTDADVSAVLLPTFANRAMVSEAASALRGQRRFFMKRAPSPAAAWIEICTHRSRIEGGHTFR